MTKPAAIPYAKARSGHAARDEITRTLRRFGCESVGFMDNFDDQSVMLGLLAAQSDPGRKAIAQVRGFFRRDSETGRTSYVRPHARRFR